MDYFYIELISRILFCIFSLLALSLLIKILLRKEDISKQVQDKLIPYRTIFEVIYFALQAWYIISPITRLQALLIPTIPGWLVVVGLCFAFVGIALRVWAQFSLGNMWSEKIRLLKNHKLIKTGPYHYLNHPMYLSYIFITIGSFLVTSDWLLLVAGSIYTILSVQKIPKEDLLLKTLKK
ncbi:MAG: isoprenylcysteine carboxylmethyltransferase family protein [Candidatus ainarchaeum sp.]|nr:isoprenylcysteine carboxylmethyltransferase family protein [Candidatus ainarchaeum sp.]